VRTALLVPDPPSPWTPPLFEAIGSEFDARIFRLARTDPLPDLSDFDLIISRLKFRHLAARTSLDWGTSRGFKVHWDEDVFWDGLWSESPHRELWTRSFPQLGFDALVVTGQRSQEYFSRTGTPTVVVHKGYAEGMFRDDDGDRTPTMAMYGAPYLSRILAKRRLSTGGIPLAYVQASFADLASELNRHLASLVCTLDASSTLPPFLRGIAHRWPERFVEVGPGPEPMLKLFESAASGCATFTDWSPDLEPLGFQDGVNAILYRDIDELVEKSTFYFQDPSRLREIGRRGAVLCRERHTWGVRARELRSALEPLMA